MKKHGHTSGYRWTPEYVVWANMVRRCTNPNTPEYPYYGGRGIQICDRWRQFENFFLDMGAKPTPKHSIDRIDCNGNYEPPNCRWATKREQSNNQRSNHRIRYAGEYLTISEWARKLNISNSTILTRLRKGWSDIDALSRPVDKSKRNRNAY